MKYIRLYLLSILVGIIAGVSGGAFRWCLNESDHLRTFMFMHNRSVLYHATIILGMFLLAMFIYWLTRKVPMINGSGIPQSRSMIFGRYKFITPWKQLISKFIGSLSALGMGMSLGREGPMIFMGTAGGNIVARKLHASPTDNRYLMAAGYAAGASAAFIAPFASVIFLLCHTAQWVSRRLIIPSLLACIISAYIALQFVSKVSPYAINVVSPMVEVLPLIAMLVGLGLVAALVGKLFNFALFHFRKWYKDFKVSNWIKILTVIIITYIGGMLVFDLISSGEIELIKQVLSNNGNLWWLFSMVIIKIFLTSICYATGLCGSLLLPIIVIGGLTGKGFAILLVQLGFLAPVSVGYFTIIGMSTIFVAVVRAPVSAMMLVLEMTRHYDLFLPLAFAATATFIFGEIISTVPVYHTLYSLLLSEERKYQTPTITTHFEVNKYSYWRDKKVDALDLPHECKIIKVNGITASEYTSPLKNNDLVTVEIPEKNYEYLFKVFRDFSDE